MMNSSLCRVLSLKFDFERNTQLKALVTNTTPQFNSNQLREKPKNPTVRFSRAAWVMEPTAPPWAGSCPGTYLPRTGASPLASCRCLILGLTPVTVKLPFLSCWCTSILSSASEKRSVGREQNKKLQIENALVSLHTHTHTHTHPLRGNSFIQQVCTEPHGGHSHWRGQVFTRAWAIHATGS
jgi:hypothetical protein